MEDFIDRLSQLNYSFVELHKNMAMYQSDLDGVRVIVKTGTDYHTYIRSQEVFGNLIDTTDVYSVDCSEDIIFIRSKQTWIEN